MGQFYNNEKGYHFGNFARHFSRRNLSMGMSWIKCEKILTFFICIGTILTYLNLQAILSRVDKLDEFAGQKSGNVIKKSYAVHGKKVDSGYLQHVFETFEAVGYIRKNLTDDWNVLWSHDYPFRVLHDEMKNLKPNQKVNHFPGSGYVTNKMNLATSEFSFVPRAFQIPKGKEDLIDYATRNPSISFVQKSNNHRGIKIEKIENLDLDKVGSFIQTYVSNPLLVDGHKFDIGIYVVLTSLEPLRVYKFNEDVLFRFCPTKYHPFDPEILDKYVIGDNYLPLWKVDSLKDAHNHGFSMREAFDNYIRQKGKNPSKIWSQVDTAIRTIYLTKEPLMIESWNNFEKKRNFFELVRFDFMIDEDLHVHLMEINMSPNLSSSHFPPNRLLYEQVLFGTFGLVGIAAHSTEGIRSYSNRFVQTKQITVNSTICSTCTATNNCHDKCQICPTCTTEEETNILKEAYLEHVNRGHFKRVFPFIGQDLEGLTHENQWMSNWFEAKCKQDSSWCN